MNTNLSESDKKLIMSCMHWDGKNAKKCANTIWGKAYLMCDGFGKIDANYAVEIGCDWSHVRDSSEEALMKVANFLRDKGFNE